MGSSRKKPETDIMMMCKKLIYWVWFNLQQICILHGVGLLCATAWKRVDLLQFCRMFAILCHKLVLKREFKNNSKGGLETP